MGRLKKVLAAISTGMVLSTMAPARVAEPDVERETRPVARLEQDAKNNILVNGLSKADYQNATKEQIEQRGKSSALTDGTPFTRAGEKHGFDICHKDEKGYHYVNTKTGIHQGFYLDGGQSYKNNSRTGEAVGYFPNGQKQYEQKSFDAERIEYHENGNIRVKYPSVSNQGKWNGSLQIYDEDNRLIEERAQSKSYMRQVSAGGPIESEQIAVYDEQGNFIEYTEGATKFSEGPGYIGQQNIDITSYNGKGIIDAKCALTNADIWGDKGMVTQYSLLNDKGEMRTYACPENTPLPVGESLTDALQQLDSELVKNGTRKEIKQTFGDLTQQNTALNNAIAQHVQQR